MDILKINNNLKLLGDQLQGCRDLDKAFRQGHHLQNFCKRPPLTSIKVNSKWQFYLLMYFLGSASQNMIGLKEKKRKIWKWMDEMTEDCT